MGLFDQTDDQWLARLTRTLDDQQQAAELWWKYYDNCQPLAYVARILMEQGERFPPVLLNWSEQVVGAQEERLDVEGFTLAGQDTVDDDLTAVWQDNDLDEGSGEAHIAAMVAGRSFIMLGSADSPLLSGIADATDTTLSGNSPLITVEYSDQVAVEIDPASGRVVAAIKRFPSDNKLAAPDMRCLYLPNRTIVYQGRARKKTVVEQFDTDLADTLAEHRTSPLVPVVPMLNRRRRGRGYSELVDLKPLVDAANQTATNMMAGVEHHAVPRKAALNIDPKDFVDEAGNKVPAWKIATGAVWAIPPATDDEGRRVPVADGERPQLIQFTASDLNNYVTVMKLLALTAGAKYGLPPHYMGYSTENPASADAIRSSEARLVKRVERKQRAYGGAWEQAMRIALVIMGRNPADGNRLETSWRDASTPTAAAMADRTVKLVAENIIDVQQAQEDLGYSPQQIAAMTERRSQTTSDIGGIVANLRSLPVGQPAPAADPNVNGAAAGAGR